MARQVEEQKAAPRAAAPAGPPAGGGFGMRRVRADIVEGFVRPGALFRWGLFFGFGMLAAYGLVQAVVSVQAVLVRVLVALFVAISLEPAVRSLHARGVPRGLAVTFIFLLLLGVIAAFFISVIPPLVEQFRELTSDLPGYIQQFQARAEGLGELSRRFNLDLEEAARNLLSSLPSTLGAGLLGFTGRVFGALFSTLTVLVLAIYFMADLPRLRKGAVRLFPLDRRERMSHMMDLVLEKVGGYMIGNLLISFVAGVSSLIAMTALDVPFPLPLAILVAIADLIPMIGATLGAVLCVSVAYLFSGELWPMTAALAGYFVVYQQVENYLIAPRILRSTVDLSAAAVLLSGLIGATMLGLVGALMAIPIAAACKVILSREIDAHEAAAQAAARAGGPDQDAACPGARGPAS